MDYTEFCRKKECKQFIEWDFGYGTCESCKLIGQSYYVDSYPVNCEFISEIKLFEENNLNEDKNTRPKEGEIKP